MQHLAAALLAYCLLSAAAAAWQGDADLRATLDAVDRAVAFMGRHSGSANLDGGIGLRTVEGQFGALLSNHWTRLPLWLATRLKAIQLRASRVAKETADAVRKSTPVYYANAGQLISDHSWDSFFPSRRLPPSSVTALLTEAAALTDAAALDEDDGFDEKFSDDCIHEFYGTSGQPPCSISKRCWDTMIGSEDRRDYFLTHQVFYLLSGINANCLYNLTDIAKSRPSTAESARTAAGSDRPLRHLLDKFCGRILVAAAAQEAQGFPVINRDLFMEQVGLCGLAGYVSEFGQPRWRSRVLSWQRDNGCYGAFPNELVAKENFNPARYGNYRRKRRMTKRSEALMANNGCLSHRTSVALDALIVFARQQVDSLLQLH